MERLAGKSFPVYIAWVRLLPTSYNNIHIIKHIAHTLRIQSQVEVVLSFNTAQLTLDLVSYHRIGIESRPSVSPFDKRKWGVRSTVRYNGWFLVSAFHFSGLLHRIEHFVTYNRILSRRSERNLERGRNFYWSCWAKSPWTSATCRSWYFAENDIKV